MSEMWWRYVKWCMRQLRISGDEEDCLSYERQKEKLKYNQILELLISESHLQSEIRNYGELFGKVMILATPGQGS